MWLSAPIYISRKSISSLADLVQIMNIGNDLYSTLSKSARETFLLLTDLPAMVSLLEINYELSYSESYSGVLNGHVPLLQENYDKFIVTVGSYAVAVFIVHNGVYKVFDSHSKDLLGQTNPL